MLFDSKWIPIVCMLCLCLILSSCLPSSRQNKKDPAPLLKVSFCVDILGQKEPVFSAPFLQALQEIEQTGQIQLSVFTARFKTEYSTILSSAASGCDIVFCGPLMAETLPETAQKYPLTFFITFQTPATGSNVASYLYREEDMAAMAGFLCHRFSKTKKIGAIMTGDRLSNLSIVAGDAFIKQAQYGDDPDSVDVNFVGTDASLSESKEIYRRLLLEQTDMLYLASGRFLPDLLSEGMIKPSFPIGVICPWVRTVDNENVPILGMIGKKYKPFLEKIIQDKIQLKFHEGIHFLGIKEDAFSFTARIVSFTQEDKDALAQFLKSYYVFGNSLQIEPLGFKVSNKFSTISDTLETAMTSG